MLTGGEGYRRLRRRRRVAAGRAFHQRVGRLAFDEAELRVQPLRVGGVQQPVHAVEGALDDLAHELEPEPAAAVGAQHVHVGEVGDARAVGDRAREADLLRPPSR